MQLGIFAKTFPGTSPDTVLTAARTAGFACAQYNWSCAGLASLPDTVPEAALTTTRNAVAHSGVELAALSGTFNMIHPDPSVRRDGLTRLDATIKSAAELGIPLVTLCTGSRDPDDQWRAHPDNDSPTAWIDLIASMESALLSAERYNVVLGVEPELANTVNSIDKAVQLIDALGARIKIVLDPANLFEIADADTRKAMIEKSLDKLGTHIALAHAKDRLPDGRFTTAGNGVIDWDHYLNGLHAIGFNGALVTHGLQAEEASSVADFLAARLP